MEVSQVICPITTLLNSPIQEGTDYIPPRMDKTTDNHFKQSLADIINSAITKTPLPNPILQNEVNLFIENLDNQDLIKSIVNMYAETSFRTLPFGTELFIGLLKINGKKLLLKLLSNCNYHYQAVFSLLLVDLKKRVSDIVASGYFDTLGEIGEVRIAQFIEETIQDLVEQATNYTKDQYKKIAHVVEYVAFPKRVASYFFTTNIIGVPIISVVQNLIQSPLRPTQDFMKKFIEVYFEKCLQDPSCLLQGHNFHFIEELILSKYHYKAFCFLKSLFSKNVEYRTTEPLSKLFDLSFTRYSPLMAEIIKEKFDNLVHKRCPQSHSMMQNSSTKILNSSANPTLKCLNCFECFFTIKKLLEHTKVCRTPKFEGSNVKASALFEDKWTVVGEIFFNSKDLKNLFVLEHPNSTESELITKWLMKCEVSKFIVNRKVIASDWDHSDFCPYHKQSFQVPFPNFNLYERLTDVERKKVYIKDQYQDVENDIYESSEEEIEVENVPQFLQGRLVKKTGNVMEMYYVKDSDLEGDGDEAVEEDNYTEFRNEPQDKTEHLKTSDNSINTSKNTSTQGIKESLPLEVEKRNDINSNEKHKEMPSMEIEPPKELQENKEFRIPVIGNTELNKDPIVLDGPNVNFNDSQTSSQTEKHQPTSSQKEASKTTEVSVEDINSFSFTEPTPKPTQISQRLNKDASTDTDVAVEELPSSSENK
ncbi:hypothetical protein EIN_023580 [Entamoeba invadens IP1]|uniref:hypothetical protein n=1 Tax=Entamoeba invadens IP1 TaxID=370355 RepID=UPI0002C3F5FB|nr:hypothetical protein EIN_023580 [Entamoeba invadens IP1]ELP90669.1 hypothetical protein EIN_023580 [Entamoeba invadens IP1]|eukprot:XP_004257440.1 hypothetical protein EIN_023580 [Entamoeba invadens IP1]